jgi:hypothetical protein
MKGIFTSLYCQNLKPTSDGIDALLADCSSMGVTDIFYHCRARGTAFWDSDLELNGDPEFDGLDYICSHRGSIKIHAYITARLLGREQHAMEFQFPGTWIIRDSRNMLYMDFENPEVRNHITALCSELADYDIESVMLDRLWFDNHNLFKYNAINEAWDIPVTSTSIEKQAALTQALTDIKTDNPNLKLTAAIRLYGASYEDCATNLCTPWHSWLDNNLISKALPMVYTLGYDEAHTSLVSAINRAGVVFLIGSAYVRLSTLSNIVSNMTGKDFAVWNYTLYSSNRTDDTLSAFKGIISAI